MSLEKDTIVLVLGVGFASLIVIQWFCWIFEFGRFKSKPGQQVPIEESKGNTNIRYIVANFLVNIINDFRHLLALVIVLVFAVTLFVVLYKNPAKEIGPAMQSVSSTFGGLIGAIIGFYFGEKSSLRDKGDLRENSKIEEQTELPEQQEIISIPEPVMDENKE